MAAQHYSTPHTLWGCAVELASALTAATILADAAVTPTVSEMTYNVSSGTLNHTQASNILGVTPQRYRVRLNESFVLTVVKVYICVWQK